MKNSAAGTTRRATHFVAYVVLFFAAWTSVWVRAVYPWAVRNLGEATLAYALVNLLFRFAIWVFPVFWYLRVVDCVDPFEYLRLRSHWRRGVAAGLLVSIANFFCNVLRFGWPHPHPANFIWNSMLSTSILIGVFEEIPFRGFMLRKLEERFSFWTAATISSVLFVGIHVPGWMLLGTFNVLIAIFIFVFGMIMALLLRWSKSLWAPIVAHSLNDFISGVLMRG